MDTPAWTMQQCAVLAARWQHKGNRYYQLHRCKQKKRDKCHRNKGGGSRGACQLLTMTNQKDENNYRSSLNKRWCRCVYVCPVLFAFGPRRFFLPTHIRIWREADGRRVGVNRGKETCAVSTDVIQLGISKPCYSVLNEQYFVHKTVNKLTCLCKKVKVKYCNKTCV